MVKENELRIGSKIYYSPKVSPSGNGFKDSYSVRELITVDLINIRFAVMFLHLYEGIPLSPELIMQIEGMHVWPNHMFSTPEMGDWRIDYCRDQQKYLYRTAPDANGHSIVIGNEFNYLHQLQNVYFVMNQCKELNIKL